MPVSKETLNKKGVKSEIRKNGSFEKKLLDHLQNHSDKGFSQRELAKQFERSEQQCRKVCLNLVNKELVSRLETPSKTQEGRTKMSIYYIAKM